MLAPAFALIPISLPLLAFGIPGTKELILVALVALAFYGRTGLLKATPQGRAIAPWVKLLSPVSRRPQPRSRNGRPQVSSPAAPPTLAERLRRDRWFWALVFTAAVAVATLIVTRTVIQNASNSAATTPNTNTATDTDPATTVIIK